MEGPPIVGIIYLSLGFGIMLGFLKPQPVQASPGPKHSRTQVLPAPTDASSLETLSRGARGFLIEREKVLVLPQNHTAATLAPFDPKGSSREKVFGLFESLQKPVIMVDRDKNQWVHMSRHESGKFMAFDGVQLAWIEMDPGFKETLRRSVPWDLIRPPRDRGGEPTRSETAEMRQLFFRRFQSTLGLKVSGVVRQPSIKRGLSKPKANLPTTYLVALRIPQFPLAQMDCDPEEPSLCQLTRSCFVEGGGIEPSSVTGVAFSSRRDLVLVGDATRRRILGFRFHSCFHVSFETSWSLPPTLKSLSNIHVDEDDRLWISTSEPDDYLNASVFYWNRDLW